MVAPTVQLAEVVAQYHPEIYQYHFTINNCYHSVELNYVFGAPFSGRMADEMSVNKTPDFSRNDKIFSLQIMSMWTNFAKYG
jgi:carboxylesterase type B